MKRKCHVVEVDAVEVLDSRGNPTVFSQVILSDGSRGGAMVPSGASTGQYEAHERRDGDPARYGGKGVCEVVRAVRRDIADELVGTAADDQQTVDRMLCRLDGTEDKHRLGANAILAVSLAYARARARRMGKPLWQAICERPSHILPCPMMNVLGGGAHADNNLDIQEYLIVPLGFTEFAEALRCGCEVYHALGRLLRFRGLSTAVGDEGGYAPDLESDEQALELLCEAIEQAGYDTDTVRISLDVAAGEWLQADGRYHLPKANETVTREELIEKWCAWSERWPLFSMEDPLGDDDHEGWKLLTEKIGGRLLLVGDDLFVTQESRLAAGIRQKIANAVLVKPNQVGSLSETVATVRAAQRSGYVPILSHRSGDTEDPAIADLAVALGAPLIKAGPPCRGERTAKYNRLLTVAHDLGENAEFGGRLLEKENAYEIGI